MQKEGGAYRFALCRAKPGEICKGAASQPGVLGICQINGRAWGRKLLWVVGTALLMALLPACTSRQAASGVTVVQNLDPNLYQGKWYEIARLPVRFEEGLVNITATYSLRENGKLEVINQGYRGSPQGELVQARGKAWAPDPQQPGRMRVSFFGPFSSDYLVIALDTLDYHYAMVTNSGKDLLWILCRAPQMDTQRLDALLEQASALGIPLEALIKVEQSWE